MKLDLQSGQIMFSITEMAYIQKTLQDMRDNAFNSQQFDTVELIKEIANLLKLTLRNSKGV